MISLLSLYTYRLGLALYRMGLLAAKKTQNDFENVHGPNRHVMSGPVDAQTITRVKVPLHLSVASLNLFFCLATTCFTTFDE